MDKIKKYVCRYAVVRFSPYPETEEFVNIGIVIACPLTGYFDFKLQKKKRHGRVTHFFSELAKDMYHETLDMFSSELSRNKYIADSFREDSDKIRSVFSSLVHPREAVIRFSEARSRIADNPEEMLNKLFHYYVERDFVTPEYTEQNLERRIRNLIHDLHLSKPFRAMELGDEFTTAHFPLVQEENSRPAKAIKPFYLGQADPGKIINHGGIWVDRIKRMRKRNLLPDAVLFAVDGPTKEDGNRYAAYEEICGDLKEFDIQIVPSSYEQRIIDFAIA